jgi:hypothetical protein
MCMYMSRTGRFALPRVRVVSPRRRGMLCSGKCCHRGQGTGKRGPRFFSKSSSSLSSPLPRKSLKLSAGPSGGHARDRSGMRQKRALFRNTRDILIPHTKISVHSIDILTQDSPCSWRGYMSTKSDPNLRTPLATRARPLSCRARIRSQITEAPRYMRRPCRPGSRRPSCSRRSPASGTSRMVFWM